MLIPVNFNNDPAIAIALAPAKGLNPDILSRLQSVQCLKVQADGEVSTIKKLGLHALDGMMSLLVYSEHKAYGLTEASPQQFGLLIRCLANSFKKGTLSPGQLEPDRVFIQNDAILIPVYPQTRPNFSPELSGTNPWLQQLYTSISQHLIWSIRKACMEADPDHGKSWRQSDADFLPDFLTKDQILDTKVQSFLTRRSKDLADWMLWLNAADVLVNDAWITNPPGSGLYRRRLKAVFHLLVSNIRSKIKRQGNLIIILCSILVFGSLIAGSLIRQNQKLPASAGMEAVELVYAFYEAISNLDVVFFDSVLERSRASYLSDSLFALAAINTVRRATEGQEALVPALPAEPENDSSQSFDRHWGPRHITILRQESKDPDRIVIEVSYEWVEDGLGVVQTDQLELVRKNSFWYIRSHRKLP